MHAPNEASSKILVELVPLTEACATREMFRQILLWHICPSKNRSPGSLRTSHSRSALSLSHSWQKSCSASHETALLSFCPSILGGTRLSRLCKKRQCLSPPTRGTELLGQLPSEVLKRFLPPSW